MPKKNHLHGKLFDSTGIKSNANELSVQPLRRSIAQALRCSRVFPVAIAAVAFAGAQDIAAAPFTAEFELSSLLPANGGDGSAGFTINGIVSGDNSGRSVTTAGDVNGDGVADILIGASRAQVNGHPVAGESYVLFGHSGGFAAEIELSGLLVANGGDGSQGFIVKGINDYDQLGWSVSAAGDVNSDGFDDFIVGADIADSGANSDTGQSYIVFGTDQGFSPEINASGLLSANGGDGSEGIALNGIDSYDQMGRSVSAAGDVNGDGFDDVIVGAFRAAYPVGQFNDAGESYVVFGSDQGFAAELEMSSLLSVNGGDGSTGFVVYGFDYGGAGVSVSAAGDINGDGFDDIIIGAYSAATSAGQSYVVFGTDQGFAAELEASDLLAANGGDGSAGFILTGVNNNDRSGWSVSGAGDVNGDGLDDIIIGATDASVPDDISYSRVGQAYVVFGSNQGFSAEFELASLLAANGGDGSAGVVLSGIKNGDKAGYSVSGAGDVNGDGFHDIIVGATRADANGETESGQSYVVFGSNQGFAPEIQLSGLLLPNGGDGSAGFVIKGNFGLDNSGISVSGVGDVNGDMIDDLIVGSILADPGGGLGNQHDAGQSYVVFGRRDGLDSDNDGIDNSVDNCLLVANTDQVDSNNDGFGNVCDADFNNDCMVNFGDLFVMQQNFLSPFPDTDLNGDGVTNFGDVFSFSTLFLNPPGPSGQTDACDQAG